MDNSVLAIDENGKLTGPRFVEKRRGCWNVNYETQSYYLEGINYPIIDQTDVPTGMSEVDLRIMDLDFATISETVMIAGNMGMKVTQNEENGGERFKTHLCDVLV